jgi:hypothetical protein
VLDRNGPAIRDSPPECYEYLFSKEGQRAMDVISGHGGPQAPNPGRKVKDTLATSVHF